MKFSITRISSVNVTKLAVPSRICSRSQILDFRPVTLLKRDSNKTPVNNVKFWRTTFFKKHLQWLPLQTYNILFPFTWSSWFRYSGKVPIRSIKLNYFLVNLQVFHGRSPKNFTKFLATSRWQVSRKVEIASRTTS